MNLYAIRRDVADLLAGRGFHAFPYMPEDTLDFPAAVVGGFKEFDVHESFKRLRVVLEVWLVFSAISYAETEPAIDDALSTETETSVLDALHGASGDNWRTIHVVGVEGVTQVKSGSTNALAVVLDVEIIA